MRATDISIRGYPADGYADPEPMPFKRLHSAWLLLSVLAAVALLMTVAGPSLSHHYAELIPTHSHVYLSGHISHGHFTGAAHTHNGKTPDVVSVSGNTGISAGIVLLDIAPPTQGGLAEPHGLWHSVAEYAVTYTDHLPEPPDRPPIAA